MVQGVNVGVPLISFSPLEMLEQDHNSIYRLHYPSEVQETMIYGVFSRLMAYYAA